MSAEELPHTVYVVVEDTFSSLSEDVSWAGSAAKRVQSPSNPKAGPCFQDSEEMREYRDCLSSWIQVNLSSHLLENTLKVFLFAFCCKSRIMRK